MDTTLTLAAAPRAAGIDLEAFDHLVARHQKHIYRVLLGLVRDPDAADTLTQDCFLRAYRGRGSFRGEASAETWLLRIALNLARDHVRNRRAGFWRRLIRGEEAVSEQVADGALSAERALEAREQLAAVLAVVERLPMQQRSVFLLRFSEEMSLEEIAEALELRVGTVKSHLARALGAVRAGIRR